MAFSMISQGAATDRKRHLMVRVRYVTSGGDGKNCTFLGSRTLASELQEWIEIESHRLKTPKQIEKLSVTDTWIFSTKLI